MNKIKQVFKTASNWFKRNGLMLFLIGYSILITTHILHTKPITIIIQNDSTSEPIIKTIDEGGIESLWKDYKDTHYDPKSPKTVTKNDDRFEKEPASSSVSYLMLKDDYELSEWDLLRKYTYQMANTMKINYPDIPMDHIYLYDSFMKSFYVECKFKQGSAAINKISGAKGIIQWTKRTRETLNVPEDIHEWPLHEQLPHVETYIMYKIKTHKIKTRKLDDFIDIYMIILSPAHADKHDDVKIFDEKCNKRCGKYRSGKSWCAYHANAGYDANKSGRVTKREIRSYLLTKYFKKDYE